MIKGKWEAGRDELCPGRHTLGVVKMFLPLLSILTYGQTDRCYRCNFQWAKSKQLSWVSHSEQETIRRVSLPKANSCLGPCLLELFVLKSSALQGVRGTVKPTRFPGNSSLLFFFSTAEGSGLVLQNFTAAEHGKGPAFKEASLTTTLC